MPSRSWKTSTWPSVASPAPIPITGTSSCGISASVTAAGTASKTIAKQPTACSASASRRSAPPPRPVRPCALKPPSALADLRRQADVAHHRDARPDDRPRPIDRGAAALELDRVAARLLDEPLRVLDRVLVRALVGAERHVADQAAASRSPRRTAAAMVTISSMPTGVVESYPSTTIAAVSPTSTTSTPASSATWAEG